MVEATVASAANKTTVVGGITSALGWVTQVNWVAVTGIVVAVAGLLVNMYFQLRRDRRESAESAARIAALQEKCNL